MAQKGFRILFWASCAAAALHGAGRVVSGLLLRLVAEGESEAAFVLAGVLGGLFPLIELCHAAAGVAMAIGIARVVRADEGPRAARALIAHPSQIGFMLGATLHVVHVALFTTGILPIRSSGPAGFSLLGAVAVAAVLAEVGAGLSLLVWAVRLDRDLDARLSALPLPIGLALLLVARGALRARRLFTKQEAWSGWLVPGIAIVTCAGFAVLLWSLSRRVERNARAEA